MPTDTVLFGRISPSISFSRLTRGPAARIRPHRELHRHRTLRTTLGYSRFAQSGGELLFHLISGLYECTSIIVNRLRSASPFKLQGIRGYPPESRQFAKRNHVRSIAIASITERGSRFMTQDCMKRAPKLADPQSDRCRLIHSTMQSLAASALTARPSIRISGFSGYS